MNHVLSSIQVIDSNQVCLHEDHEPTRLHDTCKALHHQGVLLHPPLAKRMEDGRYLILDGAHRTAAMREMGCRWLPVQVVNGSDYRLEAWDHLVPMGTWLYGLLHDSALFWQHEKLDRQHVAQIIYPNGKRVFLYPLGSQDDPASPLRLWHRIVGSYNSKYPVQRVPQGMQTLPEEGMVCMRYPTYSIEEIEKIVSSGQVMPAGVTRFLISGRLLNLKIPLSLLLTNSFDHQEWEHYMRHWEGSLRLYAEVVYLSEKEYLKVTQI